MLWIDVIYPQYLGQMRNGTSRLRRFLGLVNGDELLVQHLEDVLERPAGGKLPAPGLQDVFRIPVAAQLDLGDGEQRLLLRAAVDREHRHVAAVVDGVIAPQPARHLPAIDGKNAHEIGAVEKDLAGAGPVVAQQDRLRHCSCTMLIGASDGARLDSAKRLSSPKVSPQTGAFVQTD